MNLRLPSAAARKSDDPVSALRSVLVVDDDVLVRDTLALQLDSDDSQVATAANIGAAQAALNADPTISVVVCDIHLAQESGFDLAGALADLRPERLATEIVFITGNATSDTAIEALRHRAFDLIRKPVRRVFICHHFADEVVTEPRWWHAVPNLARRQQHGQKP